MVLAKRFLRKVGGNFLIALLTIVSFVFFLEVGFRLLFSQAAKGLGSSETVATRPSATVGWENTPGKKGLLIRDEFRIVMEINAQGLRDKEYDLDKGAGVWRAAVLGDSFAWGAGVNLEQRFDKILEDRYFPGRQFINFGVISYGTDQEYVQLREKALAYHPDLVLLVFFAGNDVLDNITSYKNALPKPLFELRQGKLVQVNGPLTDDLIRRSVPLRFHIFLRNNLLSYRFFAHRWERSRLRFQLADKDALSDYIEVFKQPVTPRMAKGWQITEALLQEMRDLTAARGIRFGVVVTPAAEQVDGAVWAKACKDFGLSSGQYDLDLPDRRLSAWGRSAGVPVLDLLAAFRAEQSKGKKLYYSFDGHLTPDGSAVMAKEMADWLRGWALPAMR